MFLLFYFMQFKIYHYFDISFIISSNLVIFFSSIILDIPHYFWLTLTFSFLLCFCICYTQTLNLHNCWYKWTIPCLNRENRSESEESDYFGNWVYLINWKQKDTVLIMIVKFFHTTSCISNHAVWEFSRYHTTVKEWKNKHLLLLCACFSDNWQVKLFKVFYCAIK